MSKEAPSLHYKNTPKATAKSGNNWKDTAIDTGLDVLAGLGGAAVGAATGKFSLILGIPALIYANKAKKPMVAIAAMGCILSNGWQASNSTAAPAASGLGEFDQVYGLEGKLDPKAAFQGATSRVKNYFRGFGKKLLIPGLSGSDIAEMTGLGEVEPGAYNYHENPVLGLEDLDQEMLGTGNLQEMPQYNTAAEGLGNAANAKVEVM